MIYKIQGGSIQVTRCFNPHKTIEDAITEIVAARSLTRIDNNDILLMQNVCSPDKKIRKENTMQWNTQSHI